jgi:hypothetical protein
MSEQPPKSELKVSEWRENQLYVMEALSEIKSDVKDIRKTQIDQGKDIVHLKWKSGLISALTSAVTALGVKFGL